MIWSIISTPRWKCTAKQRKLQRRWGNIGGFPENHLQMTGFPHVFVCSHVVSPTPDAQNWRIGRFTHETPIVLDGKDHGFRLRFSIKGAIQPMGSQDCEPSRWKPRAALRPGLLFSPTAVSTCEHQGILKKTVVRLGVQRTGAFRTF